MSSEYGSEQRNSAVSMLKQRAQTPPTLTEQQPNVLYTMPMQTVERLENVLRNTLVLQENIRSSMTALATKESLKDLATAEELLDWLGKTQALNQEIHRQLCGRFPSGLGDHCGTEYRAALFLRGGRRTSDGAAEEG